MTTTEKLAQLGRTQFVKDIQLFWRNLFHAKRVAGIRAARERSLRQMQETEIELRLDDASAALNLPPNHPLVIQSVVFAALMAKMRREQEEEAQSGDYPRCFGDF